MNKEVQAVQNAIENSIVDLLYYDRKNDDDLPVGTIERLIANKELSEDSMVEIYKNELHKILEQINS